MKHISEFTIPKMHQIRELRQRHQLSLFSAPEEKGSGEWRVFTGTKGALVRAYRARVPHGAVVTSQSNRVLRVVYLPARTLRRA